MPVSAYLRAVALLICAAAALFASAGSFAILSFWLYLAILGVVFIISFAMLDRGLLGNYFTHIANPANWPGSRITKVDGFALLPDGTTQHWNDELLSVVTIA